MTVFVAVAVAVTAVSCIDKVQNYDAERVITFKALRAESTKSGARGISDSASFKVWGYALPEKRNWNDDFGKASAVLKEKRSLVQEVTGEVLPTICGATRILE